MLLSVGVSLAVLLAELWGQIARWRGRQARVENQGQDRDIVVVKVSSRSELEDREGAS